VKKIVIAALDKIARRKTAFGLGAAGATYSLSQLFGITLVAHSSGGALLTAGSGYIAGTFVSAAVVAAFWLFLIPMVVIGLIYSFRVKLVGWFDSALERLYLWRNKP